MNIIKKIAEMMVNNDDAKKFSFIQRSKSIVKIWKLLNALMKSIGAASCWCFGVKRANCAA